MTIPIEPNPAPTSDLAPDSAGIPEVPPEDESQLPAWIREKFAKVNNEARNLRLRLHEVEPLAQEAQANREAQKTEVQRATERAIALEAELTKAQLLADRNGLAAKYGIGPDDFRYIVGDSPEEREEAAQGIAAKNAAAAAPRTTAPPTDRPVASLRPGASPAPQDTSPPTEYPAWWIQRKPPQGA